MTAVAGSVQGAPEKDWVRAMENEWFCGKCDQNIWIDPCDCEAPLAVRRPAAQAPPEPVVRPYRPERAPPDQIADAAHAARGAEIIHHHAHRNAGTARLAGRPIRDRLAAAKAAMGQQVIELGGAVTDQVREYLTLLVAWQVRAG